MTVRAGMRASISACTIMRSSLRFGSCVRTSLRSSLAYRPGFMRTYCTSSFFMSRSTCSKCLSSSRARRESATLSVESSGYAKMSASAVDAAFFSQLA